MYNKSLFALSSVSFASSFLPFVLGIIKYKTLKNVLPVFYIALVSVTFELVGYLFSNQSVATKYISYVYTVCEFCFVLHFFIEYYKKYYKIKFLYALIPLFIILTIIDYVYVITNSIDSVSLIFESLLFIFISLYSLLFFIKHLIDEKITENPFFWANAGILIYFSGNILLFLFDKTLKSKEYDVVYIFTHSILNIFYNCLLCISFIKSRVK